MREWSKLWRDPDIGGLELLHATFVTHAYGKHMHETFALGVIERGAQMFRYRGADRFPAAGDVVFINPGEVHTGQAADRAGYTYRMLYPAPDLLQRAASDLPAISQPLLSFPEPVVQDDALAAAVGAVHRSLERMEPRLARESRLLALLVTMIERHAVAAPSPRLAGAEPRAVARARDYLDSCYDDNVSLTDLADVAGLSPFYLSRVFQHAIGLSPHAYLDQVRVARAKALLAAGESIARVAADTGFADQSHLTRRFKRLVGVTPGRYQTQGKNVQDAPPVVV